ncbi:rRNA maturation RNase YbeY [Roseospira navarrensis]|uniref:Endoribonuclease YbeY n=1 Tax=Roseospira navarrensis TaxID=140058 RepID=A0A7X2D436_9PROT|nr:rRNA maturation RNase YbeY [Roseospira navarrensis]MQX35785.1 rRNA maturation RNase YbeY [Roseospira navarrensis]
MTGTATAEANAPRVSVDVVVDLPAWRKAVKGPVALCERAVHAALEDGLADSPLAGRLRPDRGLEVCVALEDDASVRDLNRDFRGQDKPTNVLAFAALEDGDGHALPPQAEPWDDGDDEPEMLGDVIVALETTREEATRDGKTLADHLTHLVVHGVLHLLGHDHQDDAEAEVMERLETRILAGLGIADPHAPARDPGIGDNERPDITK